MKLEEAPSRRSAHSGRRRCWRLAGGLAVILTGTGAFGSVPDREAEVLLERVHVLESQGEIARAWNAIWERTQPEFAAGGPLAAAGRELASADVRLLVRQGRDREALEHLRRFEACFDSGAVALLRAALELRNGRPEECLARLRQRPPAGLRAYADCLATEASCELGRWQEALAAADSARVDSLPDEMRGRLLVLRALAALRLGDQQTVRRLAPDLAAGARRDDRSGFLLVDLACASWREGNPAQARAWLLELLDARPAPADSAFTTLRRMALSGLFAPDLETSLRLARYEIHSERAASARLRLERLLQAGRRLSAPGRAEVRLALADAYQKLGDESRSLRTLARARRDAAGTRFEPEVLQATARALKHLGRDVESIGRYRELARRFPTFPAADDALYEVGWRYELRGQLRQAELAFRVCARTFPHGPLADEATLRRGLCAWRDGRPAEAAVAFRQLVSDFPDSPLVDNALYWEMLVQQALGDAAGALTRRDRLEHDFPRSYFTMLARQRVEHGLVPGTTPGEEERDSEPGPAAPNEFSPLQIESALALAERAGVAYETAIAHLQQTGDLHPPASFAADARLWRFLLQGGLVVEAAWEARRLEKLYEGQAGALLEILAESARLGVPERLVRLAFKLGQELRDPALAPDLEVLAYPAPFSLTLQEAAARHGLSHATLLGLVRRESAFDSRADSRAGARGLMQVMPRVGRRLWSQSGRTGFAPDSLYRPEVDIELGCRLLAAELRTSAGQLPQALAAYNAGGDLAAAWAARLTPRDPPELYVDLAEYRETRTYIKQVLGNRATYRRLYALP